MVKIKAQKVKDFIKALELIPETAAKELRIGIKQALSEVQTGAISKVFTERSGNLNRRINEPENIKTDGLQGTLTVSNNEQVPYAYIQHEGGVITAKNKKTLTFNIGGKWYSKKSVTIKPTKYLERSLQENEEKIYKIIDESLTRAIKKAEF